MLFGNVSFLGPKVISRLTNAAEDAWFAVETHRREERGMQAVKHFEQLGWTCSAAWAAESPSSAHGSQGGVLGVN